MSSDHFSVAEIDQSDSASWLFDLVIVGAGVSAAFSLLHLFEALRVQSGPGEPPLSICVVERHPSLWTGPAYGPRSASSALLITDLAEFCPVGLETAFRAWLTARGASLGEAAWTGAFAPRRLFGAFLTDHVEAAIGAAEAEGRVRLTRLAAEVNGLVREGSEFKATLTSKNSEKTIRSRIVLLAAGAPPSLALVRAARPGGGLVVEDLYEPGLDAALGDLAAALRDAPAPGALLIVGANASALELLFHLSHRTGLRTRLSEIVCLSRSGILPRVRRSGAPPAVGFPHLQAAPPEGGANAVFEALGEDVVRLRDLGHWPVDVLEPLSEALGEALRRLSPAEERRFHHHYGQAYSNLVRRAGPQYVEAAVELEQAGVLRRLQGSFGSLEPDPLSTGLWRLHYRAAGAEASCLHPVPFVAAVNCTGGRMLGSERRSPLLASLVGTGQVRLSESGRGVSVNEAFEAAPELFVMGPLLAGIFTERLKTWHLENARRLYDAAALLSAPLAERLRGAASQDRRTQRRAC